MIIKNLFIIQNGILLVNHNFGKCNSLEANMELISGFLSALQIFSSKIAGSLLKSINFENLTFHFYVDLKDPSLFYVFTTDIDYDQEEINFYIKRVASLFYKKYFIDLKNFSGAISPFSSFVDSLIEMKIIQKNCGKFPECIRCLKSKKISKIFESLKENAKVDPSDLKKNLSLLQMENIILLKISEINLGGKMLVIFQKGAELSLVQSEIEEFKKEIIEKKNGSSIIPLDDFIIYTYYFESDNGDLFALVYINKREKIINYSQLYILMKKISNKISKNKSLSELNNIFNEAFST